MLKQATTDIASALSDSLAGTVAVVLHTHQRAASPVRKSVWSDASQSRLQHSGILGQTQSKDWGLVESQCSRTVE